jgi:hypothetical protein
MRTALTVSLLLTSNFSAKAEGMYVLMTGNQLLSYCTDPRGQIICAATAAGFHDMLVVMEAICPTGDGTPKKIGDIVVKFLRENPEERDQSAAILAWSALKKAYPCPQKR